MIKNLYRKFKSFIYYDKASLHLKMQISNFENDEDFEERLDELEHTISCIMNDSLNKKQENQILSWMKEICVNIIPKKYQENVIEARETCLTNVLVQDKFAIEKMNYLFHGPVELHLIAFYWVLKYAKHLEPEYYDHNYANRLVRNCCNENDSSIRTFKPYFNDYANWRDNGIKKAQELNKNGEGCAILMLDICKYFYNIHFDFEMIDTPILERISHDDNESTISYKSLSKIVNRILTEYNAVLRKMNSEVIEGQITLPLGLSISPIIANYYLHEFDKSVVSKLQPVYYGRYVDDIMVVLNENSFKHSNLKSNNTTDFIETNFIEKHHLLRVENKTYTINDEEFSIKYNERIQIQKDKIKLYILDKDGTPALLEKFTDNIKKNSSEFRFIPEEAKVINEFYAEAYSMLYSDTHNKLRSIEEFKGDKFGVSKYLAKIIHTSKYWNDDSESLNKLVEQVHSFFVGRYCLEYYTLWEKIFAFYIINQRYNRVIDFYKRIELHLEKIHHRSSKLRGELVKYLSEFRDISLASAGALNLDVFEEISDSLPAGIQDMALSIRSANMVNHSYIILPLINYTNGADCKRSLLELNYRCSKDSQAGRNSCKNCGKCEMEIDMKSNKVIYSPRFVHYHEIQLHSAYLEAYKFTENEYGKYLRKSKTALRRFNQMDLLTEDTVFPAIKPDRKNKRFKIIEMPKEEKCSKLKVGIASIRVDSKNIENSYLKRPNLSRKRLNSIIELLNYVEKTNSDIVVLPEVSIPFAWMGILSQYAQRRQKVMVFGLEHIINRNSFALNFLVTIIPFNTLSFNSCFVRLRLKNHYSPEEIRLLKGYRYNIPARDQNEYDIFHWKGTRFGCFNCFELADISDRAYFKNKVDFLTASEYNRDTNYFSNIVESVSRDLHCYFIQSNSSDFGDSRITRPSQSYKMDIVKLKGGLNDHVVVGEIDILKLRQFQYKEFELQKDDDSFKPTPPNFDKDEIERILAE